MKKMFQILFVCSGNICRSPMAEAMLRAKLPPEYQNFVRIVSAGTLGIWDAAPTNEIFKVMDEIALDVSGHRSQGITTELIEKSQLILVMSHEHLKELQTNFPQFAKKIFLLKAFANKDVQNDSIPDPIGMTLLTYRKTRDAIQTEIDRILPFIIRLIEKYKKLGEK